MKTLIANLKHAVRLGYTTTIGGGSFSPTELKQALKQIEEQREALEACVMRLEWLNDPRTGHTEYPWIKQGRKALEHTT